MIRTRINCQCVNVLDFFNARAYIQTMEPTWIEILRTLMERAGDNSYSLAEKTGISQPTINRILKGKHSEPTLSTAKAISKAYKILVSQLLGEMPIEFDEDGNNVEVFYVRNEKRKVLHKQVEEISEEHLEHAIGSLNYVKNLPAVGNQNNKEDDLVKEEITQASIQKNITNDRRKSGERRNPENADVDPPQGDKRKEQRRKSDWNPRGFTFFKSN